MIDLSRIGGITGNDFFEIGFHSVKNLVKRTFFVGWEVAYQSTVVTTIITTWKVSTWIKAWI